MAWLVWTLSIYLAVSILIALRLLFVLRLVFKELKGRGIVFKIFPFARTAFADGLTWPYYIVRYGIVAFVKDIW